jgi:hypothetical protein
MNMRNRKAQMKKTAKRISIVAVPKSGMVLLVSKKCVVLWGFYCEAL